MSVIRGVFLEPKKRRHEKHVINWYTTCSLVKHLDFFTLHFDIYSRKIYHYVRKKFRLDVLLEKAKKL